MDWVGNATAIPADDPFKADVFDISTKSLTTASESRLWLRDESILLFTTSFYIINALVL